MAINIGDIPPNAVQMLFVEDLIKQVLFRHSGEQYDTFRAGPYRDFIFNGFNDEIKIAVDFIDRMMEWEIDDEFSKFIDKFDVNEKSFMDYALHHKESYFDEGFDAGNFLHYCVRLVSLSAYFAQYNVPQATDLALHYILDVLSTYDMFEGGWDALNTLAQKYVKMSEEFMNVLTPEMSDGESSSDSSDEEQMDQSEENEFDGYVLNRDLVEANNLLTREDEQIFKIDCLSTQEEGYESEDGYESDVISESESTADSRSEEDLERPVSLNEQFLDAVKVPNRASTSNERRKLLVTELPASGGNLFQEIQFKMINNLPRLLKS